MRGICKERENEEGKKEKRRGDRGWAVTQKAAAQCWHLRYTHTHTHTHTHTTLTRHSQIETISPDLSNGPQLRLKRGREGWKHQWKRERVRQVQREDPDNVLSEEDSKSMCVCQRMWVWVFTGLFTLRAALNVTGMTGELFTQSTT